MNAIKTSEGAKEVLMLIDKLEYDPAEKIGILLAAADIISRTIIAEQIRLINLDLMKKLNLI